MPRRGYRKGVSDRKEPVPVAIRSHISRRLHARLKHEAEAREITLSRLFRLVLTAHAETTRAALPHPRGDHHCLVRELARIGNNLNQLARQANTGTVPVAEPELRSTLERLRDALSKL